MIITRTPLRVSFFGGGTDLPEYYMNHGGAVIGSAIDKYLYHTISTFPSNLFNYSVKISYSKIECVSKTSQIEHRPFREILKVMGVERDVEIHLASDLPSFSGLGSSSAFTVGLLLALHKFNGVSISPKDLALKAIFIERNILQESVGSQDQTFAAFGGFNLIRFHKTGDITVDPVNMSFTRERELSDSLLLFFTGITRAAQDIEKSKIHKIDTVNYNLSNILAHVDKAYRLLTGNRSLDELGFMLNETWVQKKMLSPFVSNKSIDAMYDRAISCGALGGKILGAGGGGFMLFYVPPDRQKKFREGMTGYAEVNFSLNAEGSSVIFSS
jgi:D-glycero-alpha-D-manno-heptose-7-phosphate kinase